MACNKKVCRLLRLTSALAKRSWSLTAPPPREARPKGAGSTQKHMMEDEKAGCDMLVIPAVLHEGPPYISSSCCTRQMKKSHAALRRGCDLSSNVLCLAELQMARQNAILFTKSAKLYTKFSASSLTLDIRYPKKYPRG